MGGRRTCQSVTESTFKIEKETRSSVESQVSTQGIIQRRTSVVDTTEKELFSKSELEERRVGG